MFQFTEKEIYAARLKICQ